MADPASMAMVSMGGSAIGGLVSAFGAYTGGQSQAAMYNYKAGVAQVNQKIELQNADYEIAAGETRALQSGMKTRFAEGRIKAGQGAGGLDVNRGSNVKVQEGQQQVGQMDESIIRSNAGHMAFGSEVKAAGYGAEATMDTMGASTSKTAGDVAAIGSLIGATTSVASKWTQGGSAGLNSPMPSMGT